MSKRALKATLATILLVCPVFPIAAQKPPKAQARKLSKAEKAFQSAVLKCNTGDRTACTAVLAIASRDHSDAIDELVAGDYDGHGGVLDQATLAEIAKSSAFGEGVRYRAIGRVLDQAVLKEIYGSSSAPYIVRHRAAQGLGLPPPAVANKGGRPINVADIQHGYVAEFMFSDSVDLFAFIGMTTAGNVMTATPKETLPDFPPGLDPKIKTIALGWLKQRLVVFVVSSNFLVKPQSSWDEDFGSALSRLNAMMVGSDLGRVEVEFKRFQETVVGDPVFRGLSFQEGFTRIMFGLSLKEAQEAVKNGTLPNYDQAEAIREAIREDWEGARVARTAEAYEVFVTKHPQSIYVERAKGMIEDHKAFDKASQDGWFSDFRSYLQSHPSGIHAAAAKKMMGKLEGQRAVVDVTYPTSVVGKESRYINVEGPVFEWDTVFKELGGTVGYRVSAKGNIIDTEGAKWGFGTFGEYPVTRGEINVSGGETKIDHHWVAGKRFCGGQALFDWEGIDPGGHPISMRERVHLDCTK